MTVQTMARLGLLAGSFCSSLAMAQAMTNTPNLRGQDDRQFLTVTGRGEIRYVENATQARDPELEVDEFQWRGGLVVRGQLNNGWAFFNSDYELTDRRYTERAVRDPDTGQINARRTDDQLLLGRAALQLGRDTQRLYVTLDHSTQEVVNDPLAGNVPGNRDTRTIMGATANSALRMKHGDFLHLWANVTDIRYDERIFNEALRQGGGMSYTRAISPLYRAGFTVSGYDLEYRNIDQELTNYRAFLWWQAQLRYLDYGVKLGYDYFDVGEDRDAISAPYIDLSLAREQGVHGFRISIRNWLTETAQGNMNSANFDGSLGADGQRDINDQYERTDLILTWLHRRPCVGCSLSVDLGLQREDYQVRTDRSGRESFLRGSFNYDMSRNLGLTFSTGINLVEYTEEELTGFTEARGSVSLNFRNLMRYGSLSASVGTVAREYESDSAAYTSHYVGLNFSYELYNLTFRNN